MTWKVRDSIFDSWREEQVHRALRHRWEAQFNVFDHQPLLNVLATDLSQLTPPERALAKATSFDFTFTTKTGRPILSIEYDGIGQGYSTVDGWELLARKFTDATGYHPSRIDVGRYPGRVEGLTFKVRAAAAAIYPLLVVGPPEVRDLGPGVDVSLLDVLVGKFLTGERLRTEGAAYLEKVAPGGRLTKKEIQDAMIDLEVGLDFEENPLHREYGYITGELHKRGVTTNLTTLNLTPKFDPSNPLEPLWVDAGADPSLDPVWVGQAWVTEVDGFGPIETRFANRRISFIGYASDALFWDVLDILHPLHVKNELARAGKLPPLM